MAKKKNPKPDNPEQSARFIEAAEKLGLVDNPKEAFDEAVGRAVKAGRIPRTTKDSRPSR